MEASAVKVVVDWLVDLRLRGLQFGAEFSPTSENAMDCLKCACILAAPAQCILMDEESRAFVVVLSGKAYRLSAAKGVKEVIDVCIAGQSFGIRHAA